MEINMLWRNGYKRKNQMSMAAETKKMEEQLFIGQLGIGSWILLSYCSIEKQVCSCK